MMTLIFQREKQIWDSLSLHNNPTAESDQKSTKLVG